MRMTRPKVDAPQITIAEDQDEFCPVTAALVRHPSYGVVPGCRHNTVLLAFTPSPAERQRLAEGADLYVSLLTFGRPMQAIIVAAGPEGPCATYNIRQEQ